MENQSQAKNSGEAKPLMLTPVHVAFIIDRYFSDNSFSLTRSVFRDEASSLFPQSPIPQEVKNLPSLPAMINGYTDLKTQKLMLDKSGSLRGYIPRRVVAPQIALVVECYLCQENYTKTRSAFRTEASSLITQIPFHVDAKNTGKLLLLLNDYICLKKVMVGKTWMENLVAICVYDRASSTSNRMEPASVLTHLPASMRKGSKVVGDAPDAAEGSCSNVSVCEVSNKGKETGASDNSLKNQESTKPCMNEQVGTPNSSGSTWKLSGSGELNCNNLTGD